MAQTLPFTGRILDKISGKPISGLLVGLYRDNGATLWDMAQTGPDGTYRLHALPEKNYDLEVRNIQYSRVSQLIRGGTTGETTLNLTPYQLKTTLLKLLTEDGTPVAAGNVDIWLHINGSSTDPYLNSGPQISADGTIPVTVRIISRLPPEVDPQDAKFQGHERITIGVRNKTNGYGVTQFTGWPSTPITLILKKGVTLSGVVTDAAGKPASGAGISLWPKRFRFDSIPSFDFSLQATADANGHFSLEQVPPAAYEVMGFSHTGAYGRSSVALIKDVMDLQMQLGTPYVWPRRKAAPSAAPSVPISVGHKPNSPQPKVAAPLHSSPLSHPPAHPA